MITNIQTKSCVTIQLLIVYIIIIIIIIIIIYVFKLQMGFYPVAVYYNRTTHK
jgi:hypothetical protein